MLLEIVGELFFGHSFLGLSRFSSRTSRGTVSAKAVPMLVAEVLVASLSTIRVPWIVLRHVFQTRRVPSAAILQGSRARLPI